MRLIQTSAAAMLLCVSMAAAGCGQQATADQSQVQQIGEMLLGAYKASTSVPGVEVQVAQNAQSGTDTFAEAKGSYSLSFKRDIGESDLRLQNANGLTSIVSVRSGASFYSAKSSKNLAGSKIDLDRVGDRSPGGLPEVQAPGIDPFQLITLLGSVQWPDSLRSLGPVVVSDSTGRHVEYQVTVNTGNLSRHEHGADREWLQEMSREPAGKSVTIEVTLAGGRISVITASLPMPPESVPAIPRGKQGGSVKSGVQAPPPSTIVTTAEFQYDKRVPVIQRPLPRERGCCMSLPDRRTRWLVGIIAVAAASVLAAAILYAVPTPGQTAVEAAFTRAIRADRESQAPPAADRGGVAQPATPEVRNAQLRAGKAALARYFAPALARREERGLINAVNAEADPGFRNLGSGVSKITFDDVSVSGNTAALHANVTAWSKFQQLNNGTWMTADPVNVMSYNVTMTKYPSRGWVVTTMIGNNGPVQGGP